MKKRLKTFAVPFTRTSTGYFEVEATTIEEALAKAESFDGKYRIEGSETKFLKSKITEMVDK